MLEDDINSKNPEKDGVTLAALGNKKVEIYYNKASYNAQNPVKTMYIEVGNNNVIAKVDLPKEYEGKEVLVEYNGEYYEGQFTESKYSNPTKFVKVDK